MGTTQCGNFCDNLPDSFRNKFAEDKEDKLENKEELDPANLKSSHNKAPPEEDQNDMLVLN